MVLVPEVTLPAVMYYLCRLSPHLQTNLKQTLVCFKPLVKISTTATPNPTPPQTQNPVIINHLINQYGFSRVKAISISKTSPRFNSIASLTTVPDFLKQNGFSDTHIRNLIFKRHELLFLNIDKTLKPKLNFLEQLGCSGSSLADLAVNNPNILKRSIQKSLVPTISMLRSLLRSNENILKVLKRNSWIFTFPKNQIGKNIDFLRQCGLPDKQVSYLLLNYSRIFTHKPDKLKEHVETIEKWGVKRDSACFVYAIRVLFSMSEATLDGKFKLYNSYGWLESDILSAFGKSPEFLAVSEKKVRETMAFLMNELGYDPKDIALMPNVLKYSLEERLKPRSKVMKILSSKGLLKEKFNLYSLVALPQKKFMEKYIVKFVDRVPELKSEYGF